MTSIATLSPISNLPQLFHKPLLPLSTSLSSFVPTFDPILNKLKSENNCWERFKTAFHYKNQFFKSIVAISNQSHIGTNWNCILPQIARAFGSSDFYRLRPNLRTILLRLTSDQRTDLTNTLIYQCSQNKNVSALHNCMSLITLEEIKHEFNISNDQMNLMTKIMTKSEIELRTNEQAFLAMKKKSIFEYISSLFHGLMDTIIMAFSFFEIGKEPASSWDASNLVATYGKILAAPVTIFTALIVLFPPVSAILYTAATVLLIILLLMAYVKWLKPCPENIEHCQNLTTMAKEGRIEPVVGREEDMEKLIQLLAASSDSSRSTPIIIGPSGVGKTELAKGLALRIVQGRVPDFLKNKKVYMVQTNQLLPSGHNTYDKVERLLKRLDKHKKDVIIFFDEIQVAFNSTENMAKLGESLKKVFSTNPDSLPYCFAAATEEDYKLHILNNRAVNRRFVPVKLEETQEDKTMWILREIVHRQAKDLLITESDLKAICEVATTKPQLVTNQPPSQATPPAIQGNALYQSADQPDMAVRILSNVISNIRLDQSGYHSTDKLQIQRTKFLERLSAYRMHQDPNILTEMTSIEQKIAPLEAARANEKEDLKTLQNLQDFRAKQKDMIFTLAREITENKKINFHQAEEHKKFLLFAKEYIIPHLETKISELSSSLAHKPIDELIKEATSIKV